MNLKWIPLLGLHKTVYKTPISKRFDTYLDIMLDNENGEGRKDEPKYPPLADMNPMAKTDKILPILEEYYTTLQAETIGQKVIDELMPQYADWPEKEKEEEDRDDGDKTWKVGMVLVDDVGGGWTSYADVEYKHLFQNQYLLQRRWIEVILWTSSSRSTTTKNIPISSESIRIAVEVCIHRTAYQIKQQQKQKQQQPTITTLGDMLRQEAWAWKQVRSIDGTHLFLNRKPVPEDKIDETIRILRNHESATDYPTIVAALFGDNVAEELGHPCVLKLGDNDNNWCGLDLCRHGLWTAVEDE